MVKLLFTRFLNENWGELFKILLFFMVFGHNCGWYSCKYFFILLP